MAETIHAGFDQSIENLLDAVSVGAIEDIRDQLSSAAWNELFVPRLMKTALYPLPARAFGAR